MCPIVKKKKKRRKGEGKGASDGGGEGVPLPLENIILGVYRPPLGKYPIEGGSCLTKEAVYFLIPFVYLSFDIPIH